MIPVAGCAGRRVAESALAVNAPSTEGKTDDDVARDICTHVEEDHKSSYKWLKGGGVKFVENIPQSPSGEMLGRVLKEQEREARKAQDAKL